MDIKSQRAHEALAPLMEQIGRTAAEHGVPFVAAFALGGTASADFRFVVVGGDLPPDLQYAHDTLFPVGREAPHLVPPALECPSRRAPTTAETAETAETQHA